MKIIKIWEESDYKKYAKEWRRKKLKRYGFKYKFYDMSKLDKPLD